MLKKKYLPISIIVIAFLIYKIYIIATNSFMVHGDHALYMYMARQVTQGFVPYRDFFFAHPPLTILPTSLFFLIFGSSFTVGMLQPILSGVGILLLAYLLGEKVQKNTGLFAAILLLSNYHFQFITHWTGGVAIGTMLFLLSIYLTSEDRHKCAGIVFTLAMLARLSSFPLAITILCYNIYKKNWGFFLGMAASGAISASLFLIPNFFNNVFGYHLTKKIGTLSIGYTGLLTFFSAQSYLIILTGAAFLYSIKAKVRV